MSWAQSWASAGWPPAAENKESKVRAKLLPASEKLVSLLVTGVLFIMHILLHISNQLFLLSNVK